MRSKLFLSEMPATYSSGASPVHSVVFERDLQTLENAASHLEDRGPQPALTGSAFDTVIDHLRASLRDANTALDDLRAKLDAAN